MLEGEEETNDAEMLKCLALWLFSGFISVNLVGGTFSLYIYKKRGVEEMHIIQQRNVLYQEIKS